MSNKPTNRSTSAGEGNSFARLLAHRQKAERQHLADALAACLDAKSNGDDPAAILSSHPDWQGELQSLIGLADRVSRSAHRVRATAPGRPVGSLSVQRSQAARTKRPAPWSAVAVLACALVFVANLRADPELLVSSITLLAMAAWLQWCLTLEARRKRSRANTVPSEKLRQS